MSYSRFSDDNFRCAFYAYEDAQGYTLHVAASQTKDGLPPSPLTQESLRLPREEWENLNREYWSVLKSAPRENIDLPGAGEAHHFATLRELRDKIAELASLGFHAPPWLLPRLDEEIDGEIREKQE